MAGGARTLVLISALTGLLLAIGAIVSFFTGIPWTYAITFAFIIAMVMNITVYWYADKWVLRLYKAKVVSEAEEPELHEMVGRLAANARLPKPKVAVIPTDVPNAFATGRNPSNAVVAVTNGAMKLLDKEQLEGVLGHEMAHIKNRDMLISTMAAMIAGAIAWLALIGRLGIFMGGGRRDRGGAGTAILALLALILVPIAATLIRLSVSRTREYGADAEGASISRKPLALAGALRALESAARSKPMQGGNPATSHMFIVNPFRGASIVEIFSTHPLTEKRIQRLEEMAATGRF
ncbi:MAG: M48 family metalloprotease [Candidatus Hodarchaeaceae archaeon]|nr:M48 family metalloprotease [Candidatus Hodarchaeaceae archaeon]